MKADLISSELSTLDLEFFMHQALLEAEAAGKANEYPIGAVLVVGGEMVSRGRARHAEQRSPMAHPEMNALWAGGEELWKDIELAVLFTTAEPCPMCLGAAVMTDVPHIVFAAHDNNVDARKIIQVPYIRRHLRTFLGGVLKAESRAIIQKYDPKMLAYISREPSR